MDSNTLTCVNGSSLSVGSSTVPSEHVRLPDGRTLTVHRLDRCYPAGCGNKGPKLVERLRAAKRRGDAGVVSVGGAFSNHVHALAALGQAFDVPTAAIIRGTDADVSNPTLVDAQRWGMTLIRVDRKAYAERHSEQFRSWVASRFPGFTWVGEGGDDAISEAACADLSTRLAVPASATLVVAAGTGATARGLARGFGERVEVIGADVVGQLTSAQCRDTASAVRWVDARLTGYGRVTPGLLAWVSRTWESSGVLFDPLYNGKAAYWTSATDRDGMHVLHTGGNQGWRGIAERGVLSSFPALREAVSALRF